GGDGPGTRGLRRQRRALRIQPHGAGRADPHAARRRAAVRNKDRMPIASTPVSIFDIAGSAMTAQSQRMNVTASNLANADSAVGPDGLPYRARQVVFETALAQGHAIGGVRVARVVEDPSPLRMVHDPR